MSVIIKGMDMPESCLKCPFTYEGDCTADEGLTDVYLLLTERHPKCPLKELPTPHGRLIDADDLDSITVVSYPNTGDPFVAGRLKKIIAPTIIEAEE